jgi:hypothetical protein
MNSTPAKTAVIGQMPRATLTSSIPNSQTIRERDKEKEEKIFAILLDEPQ